MIALLHTACEFDFCSGDLRDEALGRLADEIGTYFMTYHIRVTRKIVLARDCRTQCLGPRPLGITTNHESFDALPLLETDR